MELNHNNAGFDLESLPLVYGTFAPTSDAGSLSGGENALNPFYNPKAGNRCGLSYAPSASYAPSPRGSGLLSPSFSKGSRSLYLGSKGTRGSIVSNNNNSNSFLAISKYAIVYLTFICCALLANMTQMIVLYNIMSDENDKKYILIYIIFPFVLFLCLKVNDITFCNQIRYLLNAGYAITPRVLNKNRQFMHCITFIGFPLFWVIYLVINSDWIQSNLEKRNKSFMFLSQKRDNIFNSVYLTLWVILQFIQFLLCVISLLYCIEHNIQSRKPMHTGMKCKKDSFLIKYSFAMTNPMNSNNPSISQHQNNTERYIRKIQSLKNQISKLQTDLIKSTHASLTRNSILHTEFAEEIQEKNQEFRALLSEKELLKTELGNKKSSLTMKRQQIKQQTLSIKSLQQIREENIATINDLKKKLQTQRQEMQKLQMLLQIERQNLQKAQQYFENFT